MGRCRISRAGRVTLEGNLMEILERFLGANAFLTSGLLMMVFGAILGLCRHWPSEIWEWIKQQFVAEIEIANEDICFYWFRAWLANQQCGRKARNLLATTRDECYQSVAPGDWVHDEPELLPRLLFSPNRGVYWFWFHGKLLIVYRYSQATGQAAATQQVNQKSKETYRLVAITRDATVLRELLEEVRTWATPAPRSRVQIMSFLWG